MLATVVLSFYSLLNALNLKGLHPNRAFFFFILFCFVLDWLGLLFFFFFVFCFFFFFFLFFFFLLFFILLYFVLFIFVGVFLFNLVSFFFNFNWLKITMHLNTNGNLCLIKFRKKLTETIETPFNQSN